jgi:bifunctional pyridoxal-dependent enzyme with beta-cystathionase and maltose regulon repressor activities
MFCFITDLCSNPNNPSGAVLKRSLLQNIIELAREKNITILSDEVYRPLFHGITPAENEFPPSILSMGYENTICTGSQKLTLWLESGLAGLHRATETSSRSVPKLVITPQ